MVYFNLLLISFYLLKLFPAHVVKWLPYIIWLGIFSELLVDQTVGYDPLTPSDSVAMFTFFSFINYVMLPARLVVCTGFSLVIGVAHIIVSATQARHNLQYLVQQVTSHYVSNVHHPNNISFVMTTLNSLGSKTCIDFL